MKEKSALRKALHEPLFQFLLLGALLLLAQRVFAPAVNSATADPAVISVSAELTSTLDDGFLKAMGRPPTPAESKALVDRWIDEEVMFREGQKLGMDKTDVIVRRELQQKMRYLLEDISPVPEPSETELEAWLEKNPARYGHPERVSLEQVFLSRARHGDALVPDAHALLKQLQTHPDSNAQVGDPFPGGRAWNNQNEVELRRAFGGGFVVGLREMPIGQWGGPVVSSLGMHLVRIKDRSGFQPAALGEVRTRVTEDWKLAQRERLNRESVQHLRRHYTVMIDGRPQS